MPRPRSKKPRSFIATVRFTEGERREMRRVVRESGQKSLSEYIRSLHTGFMEQQQLIKRKEVDYASQFPKKKTRLFHKTRFGKILWGDSRSYLFDVARKNSVNLIMTSPPFGLVYKKTYGNEDATQYCEWFRPFAEGFRRVLKDDGSLVIDIGGSWTPGQPTRSLYHFKLLVMLVEEFGFHLCQEHYWWNPSKLPAPAEWVNVRRMRVKDAVNCIWWLAKTPFPKADNRRVLQPYSMSMHNLLKNGHAAKLRPSGHGITVKFQKDNGGSVPPNLLAVANTESVSRYQEYCRDNNIPIHPARFPAQVPEYFIRMLTDPGEMVLDPFAGSCVTGAVAEATRRKWICCELSERYLQGAISRFTPQVPRLPKDRAQTYEICSPCALSDGTARTRALATTGRHSGRSVMAQRTEPSVVQSTT